MWFLIVSFPDLCTLTFFDICMEESTCHEMVIHLSQRLSSMLCFLYVFALFISSKNAFHVDAERMIVKTREM